MAFDYRKEYREFYLPKNAPQIVTVPPANYIAVRGQGDPNAEGGAYQTAVGVLCGGAKHRLKHVARQYAGRLLAAQIVQAVKVLFFCTSHKHR